MQLVAQPCFPPMRSLASFVIFRWGNAFEQKMEVGERKTAFPRVLLHFNHWSGGSNCTPPNLYVSRCWHWCAHNAQPALC